MTKILNFALKIKEVVGRPPKKLERALGLRVKTCFACYI